MVRLVSSRVHRCYSRYGVQRSFRNEKLNDVAHFIACSTAVISKEVSFSTIGKAVVIPSSPAAFGYFLLLLVQFFDLYAMFNAYKMFYKWSTDPQTGRQRGPFSDPTAVDALVTSAYLSGSIAFYIFASGLVWKSAVIEGYSHLVHVVIASLWVMAAVVNLTMSVPCVEHMISPNLVRAQNVVAALFTAGSVMKLYCALLEAFVINVEKNPLAFVKNSAYCADIAIWFGSLMNLIRVARLLKLVQVWIKEELSKNGKGDSKGLLSWFKSSQVNIDESEFDSDDLDDVSVFTGVGEKGA